MKLNDERTFQKINMLTCILMIISVTFSLFRITSMGQVANINGFSVLTNTGKFQALRELLWDAGELGTILGVNASFSEGIISLDIGVKVWLLLIGFVAPIFIMLVRSDRLRIVGGASQIVAAMAGVLVTSKLNEELQGTIFSIGMGWGFMLLVVLSIFVIGLQIYEIRLRNIGRLEFVGLVDCENGSNYLKCDNCNEWLLPYFQYCKCCGKQVVKSKIDEKMETSVSQEIGERLDASQNDDTMQ